MMQSCMELWYNLPVYWYLNTIHEAEEHNNVDLSIYSFKDLNMKPMTSANSPLMKGLCNAEGSTLCVTLYTKIPCGIIMSSVHTHA